MQVPRDISRGEPWIVGVFDDNGLREQQTRPVDSFSGHRQVQSVGDQAVNQADQRVADGLRIQSFEEVRVGADRGQQPTGDLVQAQPVWQRLAQKRINLTPPNRLPAAPRTALQARQRH